MAFDVILRGATIVTGDARRPLVEDGLVAINGQRIEALGTRAEFPATLEAASVLEIRAHHLRDQRFRAGLLQRGEEIAPVKKPAQCAIGIDDGKFVL